MKKLIFCLLHIVWAIFVIASCLPAATPSAVPEVKSPAGNVVPKAAWELEWEKAVSEGKKEKEVYVYTSIGPEVRIALADQFFAKYGIRAELVVGRGVELVARAKAEAGAGLTVGDVLVGGSVTTLGYKDAGLLGSTKDALILPEVKDPKAWSGGGIFFHDVARKHAIGFWEYESANIILHRDTVKPEEVASYKDLLNPKWKGKMLLMDPAIGGGGRSIVELAMWEYMGEDYIRAFARQEPVILKDFRLMLEWVSRGKYPIGLGTTGELTSSFIEAGAPIVSHVPVEGGVTTGGSGGVAIYARPPHPNAAKVFINWLLSREGQIVAAKASGLSSKRVDVASEYAKPWAKIVPGMKYIEGTGEEIARERLKREPIVKEILGLK